MANTTSATAPAKSPFTIPSYTKAPYQPASICIKKGKWYDCLRPVPGYQDFGGIGVDLKNSARDVDDEDEKRERAANSRIQDYNLMKPSFRGKAKAAKGYST